MTTAEKPAPPTAAEIEEVASEMIQLKGEIELEAAAAKKIIDPKLQRLDQLKTKAKTWLEQFGSAHAEKSRLLHGIALEIMGTFGTSTSIDAGAVETLRLALVKAKKTRVLKKLFKCVERWELVANWTEVLRSVKLSDRFTALAVKCQVTTPRTPTITPREREKKEPAPAA